MHKIGNHKWDEKKIIRMGENICKQSNWKEINLQNIQGDHAAQYEKNKQSNEKTGLRSEQTFLQRTDVK